MAGLYLLRTAAAKRRIVAGRIAWVVRAASTVEQGAIVMHLRRCGHLDLTTAIRSAMRVEGVRTLSDGRGRHYLALVPASAWTLERPFQLHEALGHGTTYEGRDCPLVRLSALHEHTIRTGRWLGADLPPADRMEIDEPVRRLFLSLWGKAGTAHYDKREWNELRHLLQQRGIEV